MTTASIRRIILEDMQARLVRGQLSSSPLAFSPSGYLAGKLLEFGRLSLIAIIKPFVETIVRTA